MTTTLNQIADMPTEAFTSLALLNIYFHADLAYPGVQTPKERKALLKTLHNHDILRHVTDAEECTEAVAERYNQAIEAHVGNSLPDGWEPTHDYWGAKCIALNPGWNAPKYGTFFAGDSSGQYMAFDSAKALDEYTKETLEKIESPN